MDKIINNGYQCSLNGMTDDTALVTVIEGNDVTLDIQLTKYDVDEEIWKSYSLYDKEGVQVYLLTPNGTHINLDIEVELDGKLKAKAESYQLETNMTYGIGVDWKDDDNDLSVKAKGMVKVVRYSEVTEDYNIEVTDNATYISIGQLPEDYITPDELTTVLDNYVTNSSLSTTLEDYAQDSELDNYVTDTDLSTVLEDYVDETELSSTLTSYGTSITVDGDRLNAAVSIEKVFSLRNSLGDSISSFAVSAFSKYVHDDETWEIVPRTPTGLIKYQTVETIYNTEDRVAAIESDYITSTSLNNTLNDYITESELTTTLSSYITDSELDTTLQSYIDETELSSTLSSYVSDNQLSSTLQSYATIEYVDEAISSIPGGSGVSEEDWDNSNEAIAKELTDNRLEHLSINDRFNNYYTSAQSDNRYPSKLWANNRFVTQADDANRQQAIAAAFASSVQSTTIHNIVQISQTDYDALTTKDTNTLYIII